MTRAALLALQAVLLWFVLFEVYRNETAPAAYLGFMFGVGVTLTAQHWRSKPERSAKIVSLQLVRQMRRGKGRAS